VVGSSLRTVIPLKLIIASQPLFFLKPFDVVNSPIVLHTYSVLTSFGSSTSLCKRFAHSVLQDPSTEAIDTLLKPFTIYTFGKTQAKFLHIHRCCRIRSYASKFLLYISIFRILQGIVLVNLRLDRRHLSGIIIIFINTNHYVTLVPFGHSGLA
jgi:hypothetical protein